MRWRKWWANQEPGIFSLYSIINQHYFILGLISEIHDIIKTSKMQSWGAYHIPTWLTFLACEASCWILENDCELLSISSGVDSNFSHLSRCDIEQLNCPWHFVCSYLSGSCFFPSIAACFHMARVAVQSQCPLSGFICSPAFCQSVVYRDLNHQTSTDSTAQNTDNSCLLSRKNLPGT